MGFQAFKLDLLVPFYLADPVEVIDEISEDDDEDLCKYIYFILL